MTRGDRPNAVAAMTRPARRLRIPRLPPALVSLLVAVGIAVTAFPEVVLGGGSLSSIGLHASPDPRGPVETVEFYPDPEDRSVTSGMNDVGARVWQLEPATRYMNRSLYGGEDPSWNPYSAGGSYGPETLADIKYSPFVVTVALLGASSAAFTATLLGLLVLAMFCIQQFFVRTLAMRRWAGVAAAVVFLLTGFATATFTSVTGAPYLLFPVALYALAEHQRLRTPVRLLAAVGAYAALILTSFLGVVVLMLLLIHSVALVVDVRRGGVAAEASRPYRVVAYLARQAAVPAVAVLLTAWFWLPVIDALRDVGGDVTPYFERSPVPKEPIEALNLVTPRHAYTWYRIDTYPEGVARNSLITYVGILPLVLVGAALPRSVRLARSLLLVTVGLALGAAAMELGVPVVRFVGSLAPLRPVGQGYWAALTGAAMALAVGVAVHSAAERGLSLRGGGAVGACIGIALVTGAVVTDWHQWRVAVALVLAALTVSGALVLVWSTDRFPSRRSTVTGLLVALLAVELLSYQNHERPVRFDLEDDPPSYLVYLQTHLGDQRVLNTTRRGLYPEWGSGYGIRQAGTLNLYQQPWWRAWYLDVVTPTPAQPRFLEVGSRGDAERFNAVPSGLDAASIEYIVVDAEMDEYDRAVAVEYPLAFDDEEAGIRIYENADAFPRARMSFALTPPLWQGDTGSRHRTVTEDQSFLEQAHDAGVGETPVHRVPDATATIVEETNTRVEVEVSGPGPGVLVLADSYQPNWRATVDGEAAPVGRVDGPFRGVVVPKGESTVVFTYESRARTIGVRVAMVTLVLLFVWIGIALLRRRRGRHGGRVSARVDGVDELAEAGEVLAIEPESEAR